MKKSLIAIICILSMLMTAVCTVPAAAEAAAAETYTWYTGGVTAAPIQASSYFIPSTANVYQDTIDNGLVTAVDGGWTTNALNDGSYAAGQNILFRTRDTSSATSMTFDPELDYVEVDLGKTYVLSQLVIGASVSESYSWNNSIRYYNISYLDESTNEWVKLGVSGRISDADSTISNKASKTIALSGWVTSKIRLELVEAAKSGNNWTGITELIPYGYDPSCLKETYAWDTMTEAVSSPISGAYSIGSAVTAKSGSELNADALYDGDYTTMQLVEYTKNTDEARTENHYYEVAFDKAYLIDTVNLGFNTAQTYTTVPARSFIDYLDADTNEWVQIETVYDTFWPEDKSSEIANKMLKGMTLTPVRARGVRYYPGRLTGGVTGGYHLSELVVYGKTTYQAKNKEAYAWGTQTTETAAPLKAVYSLGSATSYFDGKWTNENVSYLNDGSYEYENTCLIATGNGINDTDRDVTIDNFYIQLDFEDTYLLDSLLVGITVLDEYYLTNQLSWYTVEYHDTAHDKWIRSEKFSDVAWKIEDYSDEIYLKGAYTDSALVNGIVTDAIRIYPTKTQSSMYLRIDELVAYGKTATDVVNASFTYTVDGGTTESFAANATAVMPVITIKNPTEGKYENAKVITAFYQENILLDAVMTDVADNSSASYSEVLAIPEGTTEMKVFVWDMNAGIQPLSNPIEVSKKN